MASDGVREMSELDRRLLTALHADGRASWSSVASRAGCSPTTAQRHYAALRRDGYVRVVGALDVLAARVGMPVLVRIRGAAHRLPALVEALSRRPEVRFLVTVAGSVDCIAEVVVRRHSDLQTLIPDLVADTGCATEALPVMRTFTSGHDWYPEPEEPDDDVPHTAAAGPALRLALAEEPVASPEPGSAAPRPIGTVERALVTALVKDGRASVAELAATIGKSESTVTRLLDSLQASGLLRFRTLVEPALLGYTTELMVWISVAPERLDEAGRTLARHPAAKYLSATAGRYNLVGQMLLKDYEDLYGFATEVLGSLPGVRDVDLTLQMNTYKRVWTPVSGARYTDSPHQGELFGLRFAVAP